MTLELKVLDLGNKSYEETWKIQQAYLEQRKRNEIPDTLLLVEHNPTITFGSNDKWNVLHVPHEELEKRKIAFHKSRRGGGAAYLGPGQLVGYTIMDIQPYGGILSFMKMLEETMILTAKDFGINIQRYDVMNPTTEKPYRATWYRNGKDYVLCTKGIGVKLSNGRMYTHHGFCLNVNENNTYQNLIDPCGFPSKEVMPISMAEILKKQMEMSQVKQSVERNFKSVFQNA